jgi:hypothetical protein
MPSLEAGPGPPNRSNGRLWLPSGLLVVILCTITLIFYHGLWLPGLALIKRDSYRLHPPIKQYLIERLSAGELPQWFPYEAMGRPFIGVAHTAVFHPFTALYFFLPVIDAYRVSTLLSCLLAAVGAFALGRLLNFSPPGALVAGLAFALSGYVVSLTDHITYLYSICVLPLFCAALQKALVGSRAWSVAPAVVWATVFLIGDIQTGYYAGFIALAWTVAHAPGSRREACLRLLLASSLAVLLACVQLGPAAAVFVHSTRAEPALFHEHALYWSTHPLRLVTVLASPIGEKANPVDVGHFFFGNRPLEGRGGPWAESLYLGIPLTGLALLGAWYRPDLRVLALLGGFSLLLSLGRYGGLYEIFYFVIPFWSAFRYPEKFMGVVLFAAAMLAGGGLDAARTGKGRPALWLAGAVLCAIAGLALYADTASTWMSKNFDAPPALAHEMARSGTRAFFFSALAALGVWVIVLGARRGRLHEAFLLTALAAIITLDLARANLGAYHVGPAAAATFVPPFAEAITDREGKLVPGRFRLFVIAEETIAMPEGVFRWLGHHGAGSMARRQALDLEHNTQFRIEAANFYLPGYGPALPLMVEQWRKDITAAARFNVTYYIGRQSRLKDTPLANALVAALPSYDLALYQNSVPAKPRAYLSQRPERGGSPVDPATLFARNDFMRGEVDVLETSSASVLAPLTEGTATIERYAPEEVQIGVQTPRPAALILLDAYDQGWTATLDHNTEIPIHQANALVRAVVVPSGTHVVTFSYRTPLLKAGAAASLAGCLLCLGLITHAWWRRGHPTGSRR